MYDPIENFLRIILITVQRQRILVLFIKQMQNVTDVIDVQQLFM